jgi:hypothetical protein
MRAPRAALLALLLGLSAFAGWKAYAHFRGAKAQAPALAQRWVCPMRCLHKTYDAPGECPVCHMKLVPVELPVAGAAKAKGWVCPLHYSRQVFDQPGQCPFCHLQLKPQDESDFTAQRTELRELWPSVGDRTALYLREAQAGPVLLQQIVRAAGTLGAHGTELKARVDPSDQRLVRVGQTAMLSPAAGMIRAVPGTVKSVAGGWVRIQAWRAVPETRFATVEIMTSRPVPEGVPAEALWEDQGRFWVFRRQGEGFEPRRVQVGQRGDAFAEILGGLAPGDQVAASGVFWLESEWRQRQGAQAAAGPDDLP